MTWPFLTASLLGEPFSDMVSIVACHTGDRGSTPVGLVDFSPWNYQRPLDKQVGEGAVVTNDWCIAILSDRL